MRGGVRQICLEQIWTPEGRPQGANHGWRQSRGNALQATNSFPRATQLISVAPRLDSQFHSDLPTFPPLCGIFNSKRVPKNQKPVSLHVWVREPRIAAEGFKAASRIGPSATSARVSGPRLRQGSNGACMSRPVVEAPERVRRLDAGRGYLDLPDSSRQRWE
jgi:hypothetical protein